MTHADLELGRAGPAAAPRARSARPAPSPERPERQLVAGLQRAALEAAERAERIGRAAAEHHRHVDAAGDRDVEPRAAPSGSRRTARRRPSRRTTSSARRASPSTFGASSAPVTATTASSREPQLRPHEDALEHGGALVVADQQVGGARARTGPCRPTAGCRGGSSPARPRSWTVVASPGLMHLNRHGAPPAAARCSRRCPRVNSSRSKVTALADARTCPPRPRRAAAS